MPSFDLLLDLLLHFAMLSLLAVGGALSMASDMFRYLVSSQHLLTSTEFADSVAIAQIAPGPNLLFVTLLGLQAAGPLGAIVATVGMLVPSSLVTFYAHRLKNTYAKTLVVRALKLGLSPIAVGFILATGLVVARSADHHLLQYVLTGATVLVIAKTRLNPLWLLAIGAAVGVVVQF